MFYPPWVYLNPGTKPTPVRPARARGGVPESRDGQLLQRADQRCDRPAGDVAGNRRVVEVEAAVRHHEVSQGQSDDGVGLDRALVPTSASTMSAASNTSVSADSETWFDTAASAARSNNRGNVAPGRGIEAISHPGHIRLLA